MAIKIKVIHAFCNVKQLWRTHGAGPEKIAVQFQWHWTCLAGSGRFKSRPEFIPAFSAGKEFMTRVVYQPTNGVATTAAVMTTQGFLWLCILFLFFTATTVAMAAPAPNVTGAAMAKPQELLQRGNISVTEAKYGRRSRKDIHDGFTRWVRLMGSLKHSVVSVAGHSILPAFHITVNKKGNADFSSIQQAIDSLPLINIVRVVIKIAPGVYKEKVEVPMTKAFVTLQGSGADCTIIQWGDTATTIGSNGRPLGTFFSATVAVNAPFFIATNITFKNTSPLPESGAVGRQAVALRITGDMATFVGCNFLGAQDTLYDHVGRHYFKKCYIQGSVDFIFGDGLSLYQDCHLHAISTTYGALTAQKRESVLEATGFSFVNCKVTGSGALYLGRAWGTFSRVVFAYTYMDKIILPTGWYDWGDHSRDMTVFFGQYKCAGPGASFSGRVSWSRELTDEEAKPFISLSFIDGDDWIRL